MKFTQNKVSTALAIAIAIALTGCGKPDEQPMPQGSPINCSELPDPPPADDSATARAAALTQGNAARDACWNSPMSHQDRARADLARIREINGDAGAGNGGWARADLARIREIKEKEQKDLVDKKISEKEWGKQLNQGANTPLKEYKY